MQAQAQAPSGNTPDADSKPQGEERDHLLLIAEMTREFAAANDYKAVAHTALERITKYMSAEAASLFLLSDSGDSLVCVACYGPVDITGLSIPATTGVVGRSVISRKGLLVRDVSQDSDFGAAVDAKTGFTTRSLLVAPLAIGKECLGAIEIINRTTGDGLFSDEDMLLLETLARAAALAINNFRLTHKIVQQERDRHELELAAEIQRDLLPQASTRDFPIHGINIPARSVSGDFYDIITLPDGRIWFNVADVSGKGMNAALLMAKTSSLFRCLAKSAENPGQLLSAINNELCETNSHGMFVTMVGGLFDPAIGMVRLANAGHEPPLLFDARTERFTAVQADAPPLGIAPDIAGSDGFPVREIYLGGGTLYVFTDGLTEATTFGGGMLGIDGVRALIRDHADQSPDLRLKSIAGAVKLPGQSLRDDLTLLVAEDMAIGPMGAKPPAESVDTPADEQILRIRVPGRADRLKLIRAATEQAAKFIDAPEAWTFDLKMAVDEACQNIVRHAYKNSPDAGDIVIDFRRRGGILEVDIMDFAEAVDPETIRPRDITEIRPGGLGVHLIKSVCDEANFVPPPPGVGNLFKLTKRLPPKIQ
ncbi:MAG: SpoIIE family protein phosphatase [Proteobacteria bacterium]|nr:SpoIIE family protein phosphatase [Pseudomonadota bacterium]